MSLRFKTNLLEHARAISLWARAHGAQAFVDLLDLRLGVQRGRRGADFCPQYVGHRANGSLGYFPKLGPHCIGFVGWLPYPRQQWRPLSTSKLAFKALAGSLGLRTPEHWRDAAAAEAPFIAKADRSSFGYGIRGPYLPAAGRDGTVRLRAGEFAEAFKTGRIARAWYWAGRLAVLEAYPMPRVTGNGRDSFMRLLAAGLGAGQPLPAGVAEVARVQGFEPASVVPAGRSLIADFRYVSPLNPTVYANHNLLAATAGDEGRRIAEPFVAAGRALWPHIPGASDRPMAYVLDAIVDDRDTAWFLEINSNAQLHPDLYPVMLQGLLGD